MQARDAIKLVDPLKTMDEAMVAAALVMRIPPDEIVEEDVVLLDEFTKSLRTVLIQPSLPPNSFLDKARAQKVSV